MSAIKNLLHLTGIPTDQLTKEESFILEAEFLIQICNELKQYFKVQYYKEYFYLMKFTNQMEEAMLESTFISCVIKDILSTEDYTLPGIAYYTQTPEEVLYDVAMGRNTNPSITFFN
jgi:hypothetical protein